MLLTPYFLTSRIISTIFFLCTWFGVATSPEIPSNCIRSPTRDPSGGRIRAPFKWSGVEAHKSIPFDGYPASFLVFILHITHTSWPTIDSAEWKARIPDPINLTYHYLDDSKLQQCVQLEYPIDSNSLQEIESLISELTYPLIVINLASRWLCFFGFNWSCGGDNGHERTCLSLWTRI